MLGDVIKNKRKLLGLTQKQLAESVGIAQTMISKTEKNKLKPSINTLEKIAKALGTTASKLMDSNESEKESTEK